MTLDEDEVAQAGEALRLRAAAVNELDKAGEEAEQALKRNHDAMRDVLEDLRSLRRAVKNEADPSQAAREILRRQIEASSVQVLSLKARLKKAKEIFDKAGEDLAGAEEERYAACTLSVRRSRSPHTTPFFPPTFRFCSGSSHEVHTHTHIYIYIRYALASPESSRHAVVFFFSSVFVFVGCAR